MLAFATSSKSLYVFYSKWVHSPAEPPHNLQNQDIIWFLHYNVIHSPTSLSAIVQLYEYIFSSHPPPFFLGMLWRCTLIWTNLMDLEQTVNMGSVWPFLPEQAPRAIRAGWRLEVPAQRSPVTHPTRLQGFRGANRGRESAGRFFTR